MDITFFFDEIVSFLRAMVAWLQTYDIIIGESSITFYDLAIGLMLADCCIVSLVPFGGSDEND